MNTAKIRILPLMIIGVLAGCGSENDTSSNASDKSSNEIVQTVEWYKNNDEKRIEVLSRCNNNPGELAITPNCVNASRAHSQKKLNGTSVIQVAPLTFKKPEQK